MIKKRGVISFILLSMITGGIYGWWRIHVLARDVNLMCAGDGKKTAGFLALFFLTPLTLSIYNWIWWYSLGDRLYENAKRYNRSFKESGGTVLLWLIPGSFIIVGPIIALHIIFKNTNELADEYNKSQGTVTIN